VQTLSEGLSSQFSDSSAAASVGAARGQSEKDRQWWIPKA